MNKLVSQILSLLLLLCFTVTIAPLEYLHQHESKHHSDCNRSGLQTSENSNIIIDADIHEHCELCELLSTHRFDLASNEAHKTVNTSTSNYFISFHSSGIYSEKSDENSGRAPPQLI